MSNESENFNPLKWLWNVIGTLGGIIGLSNMIQTWADDFLRWKGFIKSIMDSYRSIVIPIADFLFGWLPVPTPYWVVDYYIIGFLYAASLKRGIKIPDEGREIINMKELPEWIQFNEIISLYVAVKQPYWMYWHVREYIEDRPSDFRDSFLWFGALILGTVILFSINAFIQKTV